MQCFTCRLLCLHPTGHIIRQTWVPGLKLEASLTARLNSRLPWAWIWTASFELTQKYSTEHRIPLSDFDLHLFAYRIYTKSCPKFDREVPSSSQLVRLRVQVS